MLTLLPPLRHGFASSFLVPTRDVAKQSSRVIHRRGGYHLPRPTDVYRHDLGRVTSHDAQTFAGVVLQRPYSSGFVERSGQRSKKRTNCIKYVQRQGSDVRTELASRRRPVTPSTLRFRVRRASSLLCRSGGPKSYTSGRSFLSRSYNNNSVQWCGRNS